MHGLKSCRPANAEAIVESAEATGSEVPREALRYPSESGGWPLGNIDLSEHLASTGVSVFFTPHRATTQSSGFP
jgi:hypothetical protein